MYSRILVPTDGSPCSDQAVEEAVRLAESLAAEMTAVCVVDVFSTMRDGMVEAQAVVEQMRAGAREAVERAVEAGRRAGLVAHGEVVEGNPAEEILRQSRQFDLVVMASHGKGLVKRLVLGSVVQAVLPHVDRPVLIVHCKRHPSSAGE
jgi:nucleotide-binding universal stress UspA family protein